MLLRLSIMIVLFTIQSASAQYMSRQLVAVGGSSNQIQGLAIQQAIGEPVISRTLNGNNFRTQQGFIHSSLATSAEFELSATLYPNPGNGMFTVETNTPPGTGLSIIVTDAAGKMIKEDQILSGSCFNAVPLASGTYFIHISALDQSFVLPYIVTP